MPTGNTHPHINVVVLAAARIPRHLLPRIPAARRTVGQDHGLSGCDGMVFLRVRWILGSVVG